MERWAPNSVRHILKRPLYRGVDFFGRTKTAYGRELGARRKTNDGREREVGWLDQPEETWVKLDLPYLRVVDAKTAARVDRRFDDNKARRNVDVGGRPPKAPGGYLLTGGMLKCPVCGGNFESAGGTHYVCAKRRRAAACKNTLRLPIRETDEAILAQFEGDALSPQAVEALLATVDTSGAGEEEHLKAEVARLEGEMKRLTDSIAEGVPAATVAPAIRDRQADLKRTEARLRAPRPATPDVKALRAALEQTTAEWRETLRSEPRLARMLLRRLVGPITLWKDEPLPKWLKSEIVKWRAESKVAGELNVQPTQSPRGSRIS